MPNLGPNPVPARIQLTPRRPTLPDRAMLNPSSILRNTAQVGVTVLITAAPAAAVSRWS